MAKQTIKYTRIRARVKKGQGGAGMVRCNMCGGTGWHKAPKRKK